MIFLEGQKVVQLYDGYVDKGENSIIWNGINSNGIKVGSGNYFIKASNNKDKSWNQNRIKHVLNRNEKLIESYLEKLEKLEDLEEVTVSKKEKQEIKSKLLRAKENRIKLNEIKTKVEASKEKSVCFSDEDSRRLTKRGGLIVGYNVQSAVDAKHHLIIASEVTQKACDNGLLCMMVDKKI